MGMFLGFFFSIDLRGYESKDCFLLTNEKERKRNSYTSFTLIEVFLPRSVKPGTLLNVSLSGEEEDKRI